MGDVLATIRRRANENPDRLLYSFLDSRGCEVERLTRAGLLERTDLLAGHLSALPGAASGARMLLAYPPGLEMICAFFGCVRAGLIPVPVGGPSRFGLQAGLHRMELASADCTPLAVLTTSEVRATVREALDTSWGRLAALPWVATNEMKSPSKSAWRSIHSPILFLQYTSGSTLQPRGVVVSHDNVLSNARLTVDHADAVGVSWLPQHHDMGLIGYYINGALTGGTLYGFAPAAFVQRPALWLESISRYHATATSAPNFALEHCLQRVNPSTARDLDLSSLKFLMTAAEPVKPDVYRAFLQAFAPYGLRAEAFVVAYGLAENTLAVSSYGRRSLSLHRRSLAKGRARVTARVADVSAARHLMSCGRPLGDGSVQIVDPNHRRLLPDGVVGEIWLAGPSKCLGYWGDPAATKATFDARLAGEEHAPPGSGRLRTGDLGFMHEGELYVCGRRKDLIIVRGMNVYPQDVEAVVEEAFPSVRKGGVAAFEPDNQRHGGIVVMVEATGLITAPDPHGIATAVRADLGFNVDEVVLVTPKSIPKTSSGKVRRFLARQMLAEARIPVLARVQLRLADAEAPAPSGPFAEIRARYGLTGDETCSLADVGVDSLDLVVFLHELNERLTAAGAGDLVDQIDMRTVQERTVAELFGVARRLETNRTTALAQLRLMVSHQAEAGPRADRDQMRADRRLDLPTPSAASSPHNDTPACILLTGGTGFLGPFLLTSLLEQTSAKLHVLVRAQTDVEAEQRLRAHLTAAAPRQLEFWAAFDARVVVLAGDLEKPAFGLDDVQWRRLADEVDAIYHNGALVNYLLTYQRMRATNVLGTKEILRLAFEMRRKVVNHVSTTFIFGWATAAVLHETDDNSEMARLNFGYSQSKWVAEQLVIEACRRGLPTRIFRPALITPSTAGGGTACDISLRLLAFMIKHGIWVTAANQVSFLPAEVVATNLVAIASRPETLGQTFHMTRDAYHGMADILDVVTRLTGHRFDTFELGSFVPEVICRCTRADPLFPLLDFLVGSIDSLSDMEFKRYDNSGYRRAREASPAAVPEPSLEDTMWGILRFLMIAEPPTSDQHPVPIKMK